MKAHEQGATEALGELDSPITGQAAGTGRMFFTRAMTCVMLANFLTIVVTNLVYTTVPHSLPVYLVSLGLAFGVQRMGRFRTTPRGRRDPWVWVMAAVTVVLLTAIRIPYPLEWIPGNNVFVQLDDNQRLCGLVAMTLGKSYPLAHPANPAYLYSYYYAALYPGAMFKLLVPVLTLKDCLFLENLLYHVLLAGSLVEVSGLLMRTRWQVRTLVFLTSLFGGLGWMWYGFRLSDAGWWQSVPFSNATASGISSYFSAEAWTVHQVAAVYAVVLAYVFLTRCRFANRHIKAGVVLALCASAFYSSPFTVASVPLFALANARVVWRKLILTPAMPVVVLAGLAPMFLFFGKPAIPLAAGSFRAAFTGDFWVDKVLSFPIYLTFVPLVDFAAVPWLVGLVWGRLRQIERRYFLAAAIFFISTYWFAVAPRWGNNYCIRGMLLPTFIFYAIFAAHVEEIFGRLSFLRIGRAPVFAAAVVILLGLGVAGTVKEYGWCQQQTVRGSTLYQDYANWHPENWGIGDYALLREFHSRDYARNRDIQTIHIDNRTPNEWINLTHWWGIYNFEKKIDAKDPVRMLEWELQCIRSPRVGFYK